MSGSPDITDGRWTLFSHDRETGRMVWIIVEEDGRVHARIDEPIEATFDANAAARAANAGRRWGAGQLVFSMPPAVYYQKLDAAMKQRDHKYLAKFLNDGGNYKFRTKEGKL